MKVNGIEIPQEALDGAQNVMAEKKVFMACQIYTWMGNAFPEYSTVCYRAVDRLFQKLRKEGVIKYVRGRWHWLGRH